VNWQVSSAPRFMCSTWMPNPDGGFCVECLEKALQTFGTPDIFNTDQGCQFTADVFTSVLKTHGKASVWMDAGVHVFVERLWRDVKHEDVYLKGYATVPEVQTGLTEYFVFCNSERTHQSLDYSTPDKVYRTASGGGARIVDKFKEKNVVLPQKTGQPAELQSIEARQPKTEGMTIECNANTETFAIVTITV
jgi:putative transposase